MEGTSTVLSIWKEKCDQSPEIGTFKTLSLSTSFEKLESNLKEKKNIPTDPNFEDHAIGITHLIFGLDISLFLVILIQYSPKHSVINHCDIHTTPLSDTDTVQSET
jgi:hypothetical protein